MTDYYDVSLKQRRHQMLKQHSSFTAYEALLEDEGALMQIAIMNRRSSTRGAGRAIRSTTSSYVDANLVGSFNVLEAARELGSASADGVHLICLRANGNALW